jgi:hypothetical protein
MGVVAVVTVQEVVLKVTVRLVSTQLPPLDRLQWCISSAYNSPLQLNFNSFIMGVVTVDIVQEVILKLKLQLVSTQLPLDRLQWCISSPYNSPLHHNFN